MNVAPFVLCLSTAPRPFLRVMFACVCILASGFSSPNAIAQVADDKDVSAATEVSREPSETAEKAYELRYKFVPNQTLRYETTQTVIQTGVASFGEKVETDKAEQRRVYTITDVANGDSATASMQFEFVRMERDTANSDPIVFDTTMKQEDIPQFFRGAAKGLKAKAPTYELLSIGIEVNDEKVEQTPAGGQASFVFPLPAEPKAIGSAWTTFVEVRVRLAEQMFRTVRIRKTFRLTAVEDGIAEISMSTSTVGSVTDPRVKVQLLQATPSGTIWFDINRGLVTKKEFRFNNTVLNALGPKTLVSSKGRIVERLL